MRTFLGWWGNPCQPRVSGLLLLLLLPFWFCLQSASPSCQLMHFRSSGGCITSPLPVWTAMEHCHRHVLGHRSAEASGPSRRLRQPPHRVQTWSSSMSSTFKCKQTFGWTGFIVNKKYRTCWTRCRLRVWPQDWRWSTTGDGGGQDRRLPTSWPLCKTLPRARKDPDQWFSIPSECGGC